MNEPVYDALRRQVYTALLRAAEQVASNSYAEAKRRNKGRHPKQYNPGDDVRRWTDAAGCLHKMTDTEVEGLLAEITSPVNLERRFTSGAASKL